MKLTFRKRSIFGKKTLPMCLPSLRFHRNTMFATNENFLLSLWIFFFLILENSDFVLNIKQSLSDFFKNVTIFTGKHPHQSLFLIKLWIRDSNTGGVFLWILRIFLRTSFLIENLRWLILVKSCLTHFEPIFTFYDTWKHQKTLPRRHKTYIERT